MSTRVCLVCSCGSINEVDTIYFKVYKKYVQVRFLCRHCKKVTCSLMDIVIANRLYKLDREKGVNNAETKTLGRKA